MIYIYIAIYLIGCYLSYKAFIYDMTENFDVKVKHLSVMIFVVILSWCGAFASIYIILARKIEKKYGNKVLFKKRVKK